MQWTYIGSIERKERNISIDNIGKILERSEFRCEILSKISNRSEAKNAPFIVHTIMVGLSERQKETTSREEADAEAADADPFTEASAYEATARQGTGVLLFLRQRDTARCELLLEVRTSHKSKEELRFSVKAQNLSCHRGQFNSVRYSVP